MQPDPCDKKPVVRPLSDAVPVSARSIRATGHRKGHRRANSIIEMAIVMQVLLWLCMGMAEFGQYFYIRSAFVSAARDVARASIMASAVVTDPATAATRTLGFANVTFQASWLTIQNVSGTPYTVTDVSTVAPGQALQFTIQTAYNTIPVVYRPLYNLTGQGIKNGKMVIGQCTMIKE